MGMVNKVRVSLCDTLGYIRVHSFEVPCCVQHRPEPVHLGALCEPIQLRRLGSTHWPLGRTLRIRVIKSAGKNKNFFLLIDLSGIFYTQCTFVDSVC